MTKRKTPGNAAPSEVRPPAGHPENPVVDPAPGVGPLTTAAREVADALPGGPWCWREIRSGVVCALPQGHEGDCREGQLFGIAGTGDASKLDPAAPIDVASLYGAGSPLWRDPPPPTDPAPSVDAAEAFGPPAGVDGFTTGIGRGVDALPWWRDPSNVPPAALETADPPPPVQGACPFCGGVARVVPHNWARDHEAGRVRCDDCGALGPDRLGDDAVAAWNDRSGPRSGA